MVFLLKDRDDMVDFGRFAVVQENTLQNDNKEGLLCVVVISG